MFRFGVELWEDLMCFSGCFKDRLLLGQGESAFESIDRRLLSIKRRRGSGFVGRCGGSQILSKIRNVVRQGVTGSRGVDERRGESQVADVGLVGREGWSDGTAWGSQQTKFEGLCRVMNKARVVAV